MKFTAIIPARYASSRFPGKPLALLGDRPVIEHVYRRVAAVIPDAVVATDDDRIFRAVESFGGRAVMTSAAHRSGTDRCREAADNIGTDADVIINVQGDEPFIAASQLETLMACFDAADVDIASLARPFDASRGYDALADPNLVKVVMGNDRRALYFSRSVIPYVRDAERRRTLEGTEFFTHVGVYAYRREVLAELASLPPAPLETAESLEQLRWLSAGYTIRMGLTTAPTIGIDTPADLEAARKYFKTLN